MTGNYLKESEIYKKLWTNAMNKFSLMENEIDPYLANLDNDTRLGISLIIRPDEAVINNTVKLINELRIIEPNQYYYKASELHTTVLSIITVAEDFKISNRSINKYIALLENILHRFNGFDIHYRGVTASPGSVLIKGYAEHNYLNMIRDSIRLELKDANLGKTLDTRYAIVTAHCTCMRFSSRLINPSAFTKLLLSKRKINIGTSHVNDIYFVENDWFMSDKKVKILSKYYLSNCIISK